MSNFTRRTKNPKTGTFDDAEYLDNYFGTHIYAVRFPDGTIYREDSVDYWETDEPDPNGFELQDDGTVTSAGNTSNTLKTQLKTSSDEELRKLTYDYIRIAMRYSYEHKLERWGVMLDDTTNNILKLLHSCGDPREIEAQIYTLKEMVRNDTYTSSARKVDYVPVFRIEDKISLLENRLAELKKMKGKV